MYEIHVCLYVSDYGLKVTKVILDINSVTVIIATAFCCNRKSVKADWKGLYLTRTLDGIVDFLFLLQSFSIPQLFSHTEEVPEKM